MRVGGQDVNIVPRGCLAILPATSKSTHPFPKGITISGVKYTKVTIQRRGIPLGEGYAVTDYYTQGMSFNEDCWVAHITPPPGGKMQRASMFVLLSRFRSWKHVRILLPLWNESTTASKKAAIVDRFLTMTRLPEAFRNELEELEKNVKATRGGNPAFLRVRLSGKGGGRRSRRRTASDGGAILNEALRTSVTG